MLVPNWFTCFSQLRYHVNATIMIETFVTLSDIIETSLLTFLSYKMFLTTYTILMSQRPNLQCVANFYFSI